MTNMATASWILQSGRIEPYVSLDEVKFSATASAIDFSNLVENGSQAVQDRSLAELIVRASAMADLFTMGQYGSLNATINTENGRYRPNRLGQVIINPYFTPILAVTDFQIGWGPGQGMYDVTITNDTCSIEREQFIVTYASNIGLSVGPITIAGGNWAPDAELFAEWTYINGWANSFTTSTTMAGSYEITVNDSTGIFPGMNMTIWDGMNDEYVLVDSSFVIGSTTVPLTNPTRFKHGAGVNFSAMPATIKQAVIHFVVGLVKQRGQGGLVLNELGEPSAVTPKAQASAEDMMAAYDLLDQYRIVWARS